MALHPGYSVRALSADDLALLAEGIARQQRENGRGGPYFSPYPAHLAATSDDAARIERWRTKLTVPLDAPEWFRGFGLFEPGEAKLVGHVTMHGARLATELHRMSVGIGIERAHHRRGGGTALMEAAIGAARSAGFAWIDLGVFEENLPARALYASLGFTEVGLVRDRFRVEAASLSEVLMVLKL